MNYNVEVGKSVDVISNCLERRLKQTPEGVLYKQDSRDGYNVRKFCSVLTQGLINVRRHLDSAQLLIYDPGTQATYVRTHAQSARSVTCNFRVPPTNHNIAGTSPSNTCHSPIAVAREGSNFE